MIDTSALNPQGTITCFAIAAGIAALVGYWTAPEHKNTTPPEHKDTPDNDNGGNPK